jgi:hypothetical protein
MFAWVTRWAIADGDLKRLKVSLAPTPHGWAGGVSFRF